MSLFLKHHLGWALDIGEVDFQRALRWQHGLVKMRRDGIARDTIMLVEHPPVVTVGRDGHEDNYGGLSVEPVFVERGGDVTYHGPGQQVVYFIFNLTRRGRDLHRFMSDIQEGIIGALNTLGISARKGDEHTGVWVEDRKIGSIGVAVKNWITFHGAAVNLNTDLAAFEQINPCGLTAETMISARECLGHEVDMAVFRRTLVAEFARVFDTGFESVALETLAEEIESQAGGYTI